MKTSTRLARWLIRLALLCASCWTVCGGGGAVQAQVARVTAVQDVVQVRVGDGAAWNLAPLGTALGAGDAIRTGKRSKADIKFSDGSLLRLGPLSSLEIMGLRQVHLNGGQMLLSWLGPGRVLMGTAAAEIKGTIAVISTGDNGDDIALYEGQIDVVMAQRRVTLQQGQELLALRDGSFGALRAVKPMYYAHNGSRLEMLDRPARAPFVGSAADTVLRMSPDRLAVSDSQNEGNAKAIAIANGKKDKGPGNANGGPGAGGGSGDDSSDPIPNKPGKPAKGPKGSSVTNSALLPVGAPAMAPALADIQDGSGVLVRALAALPFGGRAATFAGTGAGSGDGSGGPGTSAGTAPILLAQLPLGAATVPNGAETGAVPDTKATLDLENGYASDAALRKLAGLHGNQGRSEGADFRLLGLLADGGSSSYGARIHGYVAQGNWLFDAAYQPLWVRIDRTTTDLSAFSDLSLTYTDARGAVQVGRQRFLDGPTQATINGSLVRQGAREIMDAVRFEPALKDGQNAQVAFLVDAYPRNLPYRVPGQQQGIYGRYSAQSKAGTLGFNLLRYTTFPRTSTTGYTLDAVVPLASDQYELYGEAGRDTYRRRLTSAGIFFPGLYQRTGLDLYLEVAALSSSALAARPPTEYALRLYREISRNVDFISSLSRFSDDRTTFSVGFSVGSPVQAK